MIEKTCSFTPVIGADQVFYFGIRKTVPGSPAVRDRESPLPEHY